MESFAQQVSHGLQLGFVYALIALGYTMVYGIVRLINFAHGDVFMVGAFIGLYAIERHHLPLAMVFLAAVAGCTVLGVLIELLAYRPLLQFIFFRTKLGRGRRAVSYDYVTAGLMGVNVNRVISFTFGLGAALAGVGGVLYGIAYPQVNTFMGFMPGLKAFTAAVLGGIGNIPGAVLGAPIMGQSATMGSDSLSSTYRDGIAFVILILVLLWKPTGILGAPRAEKAGRLAGIPSEPDQDPPRVVAPF